MEGLEEKDMANRFWLCCFNGKLRKCILFFKICELNNLIDIKLSST